MPTTLLNAALGTTSDRDLPVRGPDRIALVSPMFDEEEGAGPALASLLRQWHPVHEIAVSINGGKDATPDVVARTLRSAGYERVQPPVHHHIGASASRWRHAPGGPDVIVLEYDAPTSKAESINTVVTGGYVTAERILIVDGDTRFDPEFVAHLRDAFYRLRLEGRDGRRRYVLEDVALQSGAARSLHPEGGGLVSRLISRARTAEYGLACLIRRGQTRRIGRGPLFGSSRLYTVVGCGFTARRDTFPMPAEGQTEDHDFTLQVQNGPAEETTVDVGTLHERGFRIVVDGKEISPRAFFDPGDEIVLRRGGEAVFVPGALMFTEDPPRMGSYVRQVERWTGGGVENVLKRVFVQGGWASLRPNVRFAALSMQLENVLGLILLMSIPAALGLHSALPGAGGVSLLGLGAWMALDFVATAVLVVLGLTQMERARGFRGWVLGRRVASAATLGLLPLYALKFVNALCFVAATMKVVPAFLSGRARDPAASGVWIRPRTVVRGASSHRRMMGAAALMALSGIGTFAGVSGYASSTRPGYGETWRSIHGGVRIEQDDHRALPVVRSAPEDGPELVGRFGGIAPLPEHVVSRPSFESVGAEGPGVPSTSGRTPDPASGPTVADRDRDARGISSYCRPSFTARAAADVRGLSGDAASYAPLTAWELLILARLAPLAAHLEEAATAYDVDAELLLTVLLNESYLDPLAVGPTGDLGLSQVTSDALSLLHSLSSDATSGFANARLFGSSFSVFDPDFSICAGAAKLAWARAQPGGEDDEKAYARYINPLTGVVGGQVSDRHRPLVAALGELAPLVRSVTAAVAAFRADPDRVTPAERALLEVVGEVATGRADVAEAYARTYEVVDRFGIDDAALYEAVLERLFDLPERSYAEARAAAGG